MKNVTFENVYLNSKPMVDFTNWDISGQVYDMNIIQSKIFSYILLEMIYKVRSQILW